MYERMKYHFEDQSHWNQLTEPVLAGAGFVLIAEIGCVVEDDDDVDFDVVVVVG